MFRFLSGVVFGIWITQNYNVPDVAKSIKYIIEPRNKLYYINSIP